MKKGILCLLLCLLLVAAGTYEVRTSHLQSRLFSHYAGQMTYKVESGPSKDIIYPKYGPYNDRLGYSAMAAITERLQNQSFEITRQAHFSPSLMKFVDFGGNPLYQEKLQAGLNILDDEGMPLYYYRKPERIYREFAEVPPLLINTLLFIENRELLDSKTPLRNPAVEWDRLAEVVVAHGIKIFRPSQDTAGASTLATQIEKYRYSPDGLTTDIGEKLRQMLSASMRAYRTGPDTMAARRNIVRDYINTTPLAGRVGFGEILGVGEGLWAWYGLDFDLANQLLRQPTSAENAPDKAMVYKSVLSLLLSQRRPSHYLLGGREELARLTDSYLRVLANAGVIDPQLRDTALAQPLIFRIGVPARQSPRFTSLKAVNSVRTELLRLFGVKSLYDLDRMDLTVKTTVASQVQEDVGEVLKNITDPEQAKAMGLIGEKLLNEDQLSEVGFSFLLYESTPTGNKLRVQTDNLDIPFDMNDDSKLDLGSTAKLRTLVTYLEIVEKLYLRHREPGTAATTLSDPLRQWVLAYLQANPNASLPEILDAAMLRNYSASPHELFFTAGGQHRFNNFDNKDNGRVLTVADAFNRSVNLVFIRMMRDISRFYINEIPGVNDLLENPQNPLRMQYLVRFADKEGGEFLKDFYNTYHGKNPQQMIDILANSTRPVPYRLAMAFRSVQPQASVEEMKAFMARRLGDKIPDDFEVHKLYAKYAKENFNSNDRAYLAGKHPLELWLISYLLEHSNPSITELVTASSEERQTAYSWLFKTRSWNKQQKRIRILVEREAFVAIHHEWQKLGYPFPSLVPSYATALGVSADRPIALTELMGILVNDGLRLPMRQIDHLHFAADTPYETEIKAVPRVGERVLSPEICQTVRTALMGIVESGTARRLKGVYKDANGNPLAVGGKTGTGDHRSKRMGRGGQVLSETVVNRNALFTFYIDDRFFGTILASVGGAKAKNFDFTSGLAAQILKSLEPALSPLILHDSEQLAGDNEEAVADSVQ